MEQRGLPRRRLGGAPSDCCSCSERGCVGGPCATYGGSEAEIRLLGNWLPVSVEPASSEQGPALLQRSDSVLLWWRRECCMSRLRRLILLSRYKAAAAACARL